ncbi:MAG: helix-turn-helix domain-containing protein [bacterium]|nr:helix-turn-helix domain-containing protein [bacterium]
MENIDFNYFCTIIGNLSGIPVRVYKNDSRVFYRSLVSLPKDPIAPYLSSVLAIEEHIGYFITPYFNYYGVVNCGPFKIVIGPSRQSDMSEHDIKELAFKCDVDPDDVDEFVSSMKSIIQMPLSSIMQILCMINYVLNGEKLTLEDIAIYDTAQQDIKDWIESARTDQIYDSDPAKIQSRQVVYNTFELEQTLVDIVRKGDTAALREWIRNAPAIRGGVLASDGLRQMKNTFIVSATLVARAAIRGGMDANDALSLSDDYIQKCELLFDVDRITNLQYRMVLDYTEQVEKLRQGKSPSKLVTDISNYVRHHLSEPVNIEALAKAMFFSRTHLAAKFKKETGVTLTDFILKEKTEEAQRLLRYTDKHLTAISAYLGFSSQSHFTNVFRKYTGKSPNEYRKHHNR